jgi:mannitol/fructose-specific phosphotransferase system IIA component (Ntr-type)
VIEGSSQLLLISRLVHPPATSRRILLLCPPLANLQPGFVQALAAVKTIARQSGVKLLVMAPEDAMVDFEEYVGRTKPSVSLEYRAYRHWKSVGAAVTAEAGADDWIVVMEARIGRIAWQPSSDRLPRQLQAALPDNNLSFIYPPEDVGEQTQNIEKLLEQGIVSQILDAEHCLFVAGTGKLRDLLEQLPASYLRQRNIPPEGIVGKLVELAEHEPVDLVPGVALLHEYCDEVDDSEIFLISAKTPIELPQMQLAPRLILILLDPTAQDPARHLESLANIVKLMKIPGFVEAAQRARSFDDLIG